MAGLIEQRRVVVTGVGVVSPAGIGKQVFWQALSEGRPCVGALQLDPRPGQRVHIAASVPEFSINDYADRRQARFMERVSSFAFVAARLAMQDAALELNEMDSERAGASIGTLAGPVGMLRTEAERVYTSGLHRLNALMCVIGNPGASFGNISVNLQLRGPCVTLYADETAGTDAIGYAYRQIKHGQADVMIAGGCEAPLVHPVLFMFDGLGVLSHHNDCPQRACRPFDGERDGFVLGEGAAMLILEEMNRARERGAHIYAEIAGYAATFTPPDDHAFQINPSSASLAVRLALQDAGIDPGEVDYVSAHGTGLRGGDGFETLAIKSVLSERAYDVPVSSIKSMLGHALGASGSMQAVSCALAMEHGLLPPTINRERPDPECDLDYVPRQARKAQLRAAVQNDFSFLGKNSVLIYKRWPGETHATC